MNIQKIIKRNIAKIRCKINPIKYAKSLGVKIGQRGKIYAPDIGIFPTEPWLIMTGYNCHITYGVRFLTHDGGTLVISSEEYGSAPFVICGNINIGNNVYIGENTTILPRVNIDDNVIIGCGSVVSKDIPSNVVAARVPCHVIKSRNDYINKIKNILAGNDQRYYSWSIYMV